MILRIYNPYVLVMVEEEPQAGHGPDLILANRPSHTSQSHTMLHTCSDESYHDLQSTDSLRRLVVGPKIYSKKAVFLTHLGSLELSLSPTVSRIFIMSTVFSLDEEVRLYTTNASREKYNLLATLFGTVVALDYLERAYVRDSITAAECVQYFNTLTYNLELVFILVERDTRQRALGC